MTIHVPLPNSPPNSGKDATQGLTNQMEALGLTSKHFPQYVSESPETAKYKLMPAKHFFAKSPAESVSSFDSAEYEVSSKFSDDTASEVSEDINNNDACSEYSEDFEPESDNEVGFAS